MADLLRSPNPLPAGFPCCGAPSFYLVFFSLLQGSQFSLREVEVVTATVDLDEVVSYRGAGEEI